MSSTSLDALSGLSGNHPPIVNEVYSMAQIPFKPSLQNSSQATDTEFDDIQATDRGMTSGSLGSPVHPDLFYRGQKVTSLPEQEAGIPFARQGQGVRHRWKGLSIRAKATILAIVMGTTPVVAIGAIAYYFANQSITEQIKQAERNRAMQLANEINVFMADRFADIQLLGQFPVFTNSKVYSDISSEDKVALLDQYTKLYGVYNSVAFFNLDGEAVVQAQGSPVPNHKTRDYFQRVIKTGAPTINPPSVSRTTGTLSMHLAAPVKDSSTGELKGVVRFQLPVKGLDKVAQDYATEGDKYFLIDNSGKYFLASGNKARIGKPAAAHFAKYAQLQSSQNGGSVLDYDPDDGSEQLLTYVPLKDLAGLPELDFGVLIASDVKTVFAAQRRLLWIISLGTAVTALLVAVTASILANRATRPILVAADAVEKIGQGDLDTRLQFQGTDEIAVLGSNINQMAEQLAASLEALTFDAAQERLLTAAKGSRVLQAEDLQEIFDHTLAGTRTFMQLDRIVIYRFHDGSTGGGVISESVGEAWSSALAKNVNDACISQEVRQAYRQGHIVVANDVTEAGFDPAHVELLQTLEVKASLIVPILSGGRLYGLLIAHSCAETRQWQQFEINFLQQLSEELGLSIYRVELLEQTTNLAAEQRQLKENLQKRALELLQEVDPISQGDLTTRAKVTADEIGTIADSYNATVSNLRRIVLQVQEAANQVTATTSVSETSVQSLSQEALRQAEEIAKALEVARTMTTTVQEVAANAEEAKIAVQQAAKTVEEGDAAMTRTVDGFQSIRSTVAETAEKVKHLGESSEKISAVVELISAFAAQTNMLALNASIEASRAGEEGRGFAVVADEVRTLARQSAEATEEIRKLIASIQAETREVVTAMETGTEQVTIGTKLVDETRTRLNKITATSFQISQLVASIAQATVVQSQASETVSQTMKDVAAIANQTSTEVNQVSSSFNQLRKVAQALEESVGQFKVS
ncbi:methyl-accepting chemotaxis protein [Kovacikia minuta CCNUW1]|uniref:methyl-accepting chemotaxis protein n=1 Tax=Kovacikia minuta TaxID=2931930 RepID=UPI001CCD19B9|nr:methyl-accepting chemotaxis protein [Kovacikia minuta]UBF24706.1 methyl-accepting chemotaxis protein [Kovacikia minuta CCNUW1]